MKRIFGSIAVVVSLVLAASADARRSDPETIATVLSFPTFPAAAPFVGTYSGTFTSSGTVADSGTVIARAVFGAIPAPSTGVLQTDRTLTSADGTLHLRCTQVAKSFLDYSSVPDTGSCAVLSASGVYAGLAGAGRIIGEADLNTGILTDTLQLGAG